MIGLKRKVVRITVDAPEFSYRLAQHPAVRWPTAALTGVSVTFCPMFLFMLGREGALWTDWSVITCAVVAYLVPLFFMSLGGAVFTHAWEARRSARGGRPDNPSAAASK